MPANIAFILKPVVQGVILISKPYYLRTRFHKAIAVIGSDSFDESGQSNWKLGKYSPL